LKINIKFIVVRGGGIGVVTEKDKNKFVALLSHVK
jgi:hypothetical protein